MAISQDAKNAEQLLGAWTFTAMTVVNEETGEERPAFKEPPHGYLIFRPDRMFAFIRMGAFNRDPNRAEPPRAEMLRPHLMAYSGPWKVSGDSFTTTVDMSLVEPWLGTEQMRFFKLDGDTLEVTTIPSRRPEGNGALMHGRLIWKRVVTDETLTNPHSNKSHPLTGMWRIVSMAFVNDETGERTPGFGEEPTGYLVLLPDRMFAFIKTGGARSEIARVPVFAYSGPCSVTATSFATMLDMASIDSWVGTEQKRFYKIDRDRLEITTASAPGPSGALTHSHLLWQREH